MNKNTVTVKEACAFFKVSRLTIYKWMRNGEIPYFKMGRKIYILADELDGIVKNKIEKGKSRVLV